MNVVIKNSKIRDFTFDAPPSKSYTHRAYAIASLAQGISEIVNPLRAGDTDSTLNACRAFGAEVTEKGENVIIKGTGGSLKTPAHEIDVGNSGTTIRLFASIAALNGRVSLTGDESVQKRPMQPLLDALYQLGAPASSVRGDGCPPVDVLGGGILGGVSRIRGDVSSQFISSLLIASPYSRTPVTIDVTTPLKSRPYVAVTIDIMKGFGMEVENQGFKHFKMKKGAYHGRRYEIEGDYSSASYFLTLAAISGAKTSIGNLKRESVQGDLAILNILGRMGAKVRVDRDTVVVEGGRLSGIEVDLESTPDLLPTVTAIACAANGRTYIKNIEHARLKESDRVSACAKEFRKFGVKIIEGRDSLKIEGTSRLKGGKVNSHGDHRMVMALSILGTLADGETEIDHAEAVEISFPGFFDLLEKAGTRLKVQI
jgi:3-phosphoshikimate 1-carboxyvinyltransferase